MKIRIWHHNVPDYSERMAVMAYCAKLWMKKENCGLELVPKG